MQKTDILLNRETYLDKVLGCWAGKNIGGTLGAPIEGRREIFHYDFYINPMDGEPAPNDDLDLQLVWLKALEDTGVFGVNIPKGQWHTFEVYDLSIIFMAQDGPWSPLSKENML